ncbi:MAG: DUF1080 domain-containing protein [Planctomycetes bacterium]|nr:DUF1080 domain-containing protein [Planctomycetota bacterium]
MPKLRRALLPLTFAAACASPPDQGPDWRELTLADFVVVNGDATTWTERDGVIVGSGLPIGGARSRQTFTNFELVVEWRHLQHAGNSGLFLWCPDSAFTDLPPGELPRSGIEVQVLDLGYETDWQRDKGERSDWFTSHGDVFPVGGSQMTPRSPQFTYHEDGATWTVGKPDGRRSFPSERRTRPVGEWNHYRVLAVGGTVRLWVNGVEVNGATGCTPATGYLALEAEGAPVEFRDLRVRELP